MSRTPLVKVVFIGLFAGVFLGAVHGKAQNQPTPAPNPTPVPDRSVVVRAESSDAIFDYRANASIVYRLVNEVVVGVTGEGSVAGAWSSLVKPGDVVGIKVCANGAPLFSTRPEVVQAIADGLRQAGVPWENIIVFDRDAGLLKRAGFHTRPGSYRVLWTEDNYDPQVAITSPLAGQLIWGDLDFVGSVNSLEPKNETVGDNKKKRLTNISSDSHVSRVLTKVVTKVVNVPVMADNVYCGLSGALFNMTVQNVDNWRRLVEPPDSGDPAIPEMYSDTRISGKVVITIMDGLVALYAGGPFGDANYAVQFGAIYGSKDPVAVDAVASSRLDKWRLEANMESISKVSKYIETAGAMELGNANLNKIEIRDVRP